MPQDKPVLFMVFNRPDTTARVFEAIRKAKPARLYIAADGPRSDRVDEAGLCAETRRIATAVDWPCEVKTLFREKNLGCGRAVSGAISWFFDNEPEGIILEDDCLPNQDFFQYCSELLEKYQNDEKVMLIGSTNWQDGVKRGDASYYFSSYGHVWGWASWRRAWENYEYELQGITEKFFESILKERFQSIQERSYWRGMFRKVKKHKIDTWDYQWQFSIWAAGGICIVPNSNLVSNIGNVGTHISGQEDVHINLPTEGILPITHPTTQFIDQAADLQFYKCHIKPEQQSLFQRICARVIRVLHRPKK